MLNFDVNLFRIESDFWPIVITCFVLAAVFIILFIFINLQLFSKMKRRRHKTIRYQFRKKKQQDLQIKNIETELRTFLGNNRNSKQKGLHDEKAN